MAEFFLYHRMLYINIIVLCALIICGCIGEEETRASLPEADVVATQDAVYDDGWHGVCRHIALFAAAVAIEHVGADNVRIVTHPTESGRHAQAQARVDGEWYWLELDSVTRRVYRATEPQIAHDTVDENHISFLRFSVQHHTSAMHILNRDADIDPVVHDFKMYLLEKEGVS